MSFIQQENFTLQMKSRDWIEKISEYRYKEEGQVRDYSKDVVAGKRRSLKIMMEGRCPRGNIFHFLGKKRHQNSFSITTLKSGMRGS